MPVSEWAYRIPAHNCYQVRSVSKHGRFSMSSNVDRCRLPLYVVELASCYCSQILSAALRPPDGIHELKIRRVKHSGCACIAYNEGPDTLHFDATQVIRIYLKPGGSRMTAHDHRGNHRKSTSDPRTISHLVLPLQCNGRPPNALS